MISPYRKRWLKKSATIRIAVGQTTAPSTRSSYDHEKWLHEIRRTDAAREYDRWTAYNTRLDQSAIRAADAALKAGMLINGGAAVAMLAFLGALVSGEAVKVSQVAEFASSLLWFGWGVIAAVSTMALSYAVHYLTFQHSVSRTPHFEFPHLRDGPWTKFWACFKSIVHVVSVLVGIASLVCFGLGIWQVRESILQTAKQASAPPPIQMLDKPQ